MKVQSYIYFDGRCDEALEFYKKAVGAQVTSLMRFNEAPPMDGDQCMEGPTPPGDKVMHSAFRVGETEILASDGFAQGKPAFQGFSLAVTARDEAEAGRLFAALSEDGKIEMPLMKTFFSPSFGMVADKFGVSWTIVV